MSLFITANDQTMPFVVGEDAIGKWLSDSEKLLETVITKKLVIFKKMLPVLGAKLQDWTEVKNQLLANGKINCRLSVDCRSIISRSTVNY